MTAQNKHIGAPEQRREFAAIIVESPQGIVMQHRDNIPTIPGPDQLCLVAGGMEPEDNGDGLAAALREGSEELGRELSPDDLQPVMDFTKHAGRHNGDGLIHVFKLMVDDAAEVEINEGQGAVVVPNVFALRSLHREGKVMDDSYDILMAHFLGGPSVRSAFQSNIQPPQQRAA